MNNKQNIVARLLQEKHITVQEASVLLTETVLLQSASPVLGPGNNPYPVTVSLGTACNPDLPTGTLGYTVQWPDNMKIPASR